MKLARRFGVVFWAASLVFITTVLLTVRSSAWADPTVSDTSGRMTNTAIAQIDERNKRLADATGLIVAVIVERGVVGESTADVSLAADRIAKGKYGAIVWVATDTARSDILFAAPARKWIPIEAQDMLRSNLAKKLRFCCPSDTLPALVDQVAGATEAGSRVPPDPHNYVYDKLGLLDNLQLSSVVAREQRLEGATGKGVAVVLFSAQGSTPPAATASSIATSLNVKGDIAAIVWGARSDGSLSFSMTRMPDYSGLISDANADSINGRFQADMQTGQIGDALVAAVDRTASALENTATSTSPSAHGSTPPSPSSSSSSGLAFSRASATAFASAAPQPPTGGSNLATGLLLLLGLIIIIVVVVTARRRQGRE